MALSPFVVLLVFYLFLMVRWQYVRQPMCFFIGVCGLAFGLFGGLFPIISVKVAIVGSIFEWIGSLVALAAAVAACSGADLPVKLPGTREEAPAGRPPQPPAEQ